MPSRDLKGRVLIITGASAGIGAATAVAAGRASMRVVLAARRAHRLQVISEQVEAAGGEAMVLPTDVSDATQLRSLVDRAEAHFGRIDALFANAGYGYLHRADTDAEAQERELWAVNYHGARRAVQMVVPPMQAQGGGHILICSSVVAASGLPYYSTYAATKAALATLSDSMRLELAPAGITVSCVYPGATATEFHDQVERRCGRDAVRAATPRFMLQSPEHVAREVIKCLRRPKPAVWPSPLLRTMSGLWSWFPRFQVTSMRGVARHGRCALEALEVERTAGTCSDGGKDQDGDGRTQRPRLNADAEI